MFDSYDMPSYHSVVESYLVFRMWIVKFNLCKETIEGSQACQLLGRSGFPGIHIHAGFEQKISLLIGEIFRLVFTRVELIYKP
jgi:hypothetical protein